MYNMWSTNRNKQLELYQLQNRIQLLRERNNVQNESKIRKEIFSKEKLNADVEVSELIQFSYKNEVATVENCYRKSKELVENHYKNKQSKKLFKNSIPIYNLQKKNVKSIEKNKDKVEVITLSDDNIFSACPETSPQLCQKIQKLNNILENCEDDIVYLQTIDTEKSTQSKELKNISDHKTKCKNNKTSYERFQSKRKEKQIFKSALVGTSEGTAKNNNQDVIYLETVNKTYESSNFNNHDLQRCNFSTNEVLKASGSKSSSTVNKIPKNSCFTVNKFFKKNYSKQINIDLDYSEIFAPIWDFTEEPVDFDIPYLHINEILNHLSKRKIEWLRSKGVSVKFGKWSDKEVALLHRNYQNFTTQFGVSDVCLLLGIGRKKTEFKNVMKFWRAKHFLVRLGKDLNSRPLRCIYLKARFEFFPPIKRKIINVEDDIPFLMELHKKYGNNWYMIAQKFHLSPNKCKRLFSKYSKNTVFGRWTKKEREYLISAIKKVTKSEDIFNRTFKRIPWQRVAEFVPTRNSVQCYNEWYRNRALIRSNFKN